MSVDTGMGRPGDSPEHREDILVTLNRSTGRAALVPKSLKRLDPEAREALQEIHTAAANIDHLMEHVDQGVVVARSLGVPWSGIGWATGLTAEGARQRWLDSTE